MMNNKINIAINGFGRIGRLALRIALKRENIKVTAVNDLVSVEQLAYLFKYDSVHVRFEGQVEVKNNNRIINGQEIRVNSEKNPENLAWSEVGADVVLECTGIFKTKEQASAHLRAGAKKVLISAPSKDASMYVMGVNHQEISAAEEIVSAASCTTHCLAVLAKVIHDNFGIEEGLMTTIHAVTASQTSVDGPASKNFRLGRSSLNNIIPTSTGAALAVTKVIPELEGKLTGMAFRVPVPNISAVDLTVRLQQSTSLEDIKKVIKQAAENDLKGILGYTEDKIVSQDIISDERSSIFDADASMQLNANFFKLIAWYDNEYGYASKLVDMAEYINSLNN